MISCNFFSTHVVGFHEINLLAWSMESGEHMPNKENFFKELFRVTKADGRIIIVTWCHRELQSHEQSLSAGELTLLHRISSC